MHACLGDGYCLLLHHLVHSHPVDFVHFVELVDADHSAVGKHHGTCLKSFLSGVFV